MGASLSLWRVNEQGCAYGNCELTGQGGLNVLGDSSGVPM